MSASEKVQRNKKVAFEDGNSNSKRDSRSRSRGKARERRAKSQDVRSVNKDGEPRKRDRSLINLVRQSSRKSVSNLVRLFEAGKSYYMTEGRKSQVIFPDERILDILIQPKLATGELLDIVSSHFKLKEKEYFGIAFQDETSHYNWLQLDKKVLEHDLPRKQGTNLVLFFLVRFYVESITQLKDTSTVELFYLNAKQAVFKGQIECDSETVFELAAHVLQASVGDYVDDATAKLDLKKLPLITTSALKEHPSIQYCEDRVIQYYQKLSGTAKGSAIVNYMTIVESLPTYGIHYFEVKDKKDIPWWLGISYKGIGVYDKNDKNVPRKVFVWKSLENLYYRDKKFSVEVHDPKRVVHTLSSFNLYEDAIREPISESDELSDAISDPSTQVSVSRRTFGPGNVNVHAWFGATPQLTKCIWLMAVAQHQFYHDRKHSRANLPSVRSVSELASELSRSRTSLTGSLGSDISRSGSSASLPSLGASRFDLNFDPADTAKVQREMCTALKARREALEEILKKRTEELKLLCIKEGELTGHLPAEIPLAPGEQPPQIRRRVGTAFSLNTSVVPGGDKKEEEDVSSGLQLELELQKQITNAAHKLASDKSVSRYVRKQRRQSFIKAQTKLKEMEKKLSDHRKGGSKDGKSKDGHKTSSPARRVSSPAPSPLIPRGPKSNYNQHEGRLNESPIHRSATAPRELNPDPGSMISLTPTLSSPSLELSHEATNPLCSTQYQTYPNLPNLNQRSGSSCSNHSNHSNQSDYDNNRTGGRLEGSQMRLEGSQDSGFSSTNNMYGVSSRRTSRYDSNKDLVSPSDSHREGIDTVFDNKLSLQSKHGSLENTSAYNSRKPPHGYGSLERNLRKKSDRRYERKHSDTDTNTNYNDLTPAKFGSKRTSQSEYDLSSKGSEFSSVNNSDFPSSSRKFSYDSRTPSTDYSSSRTPSVDYSYKSDHYTPTMSRKLIEVPVMHEGYSSRSDHHHGNEYHSQSRTGWHEPVSMEPSPMIRSPTKSHSDNYLSAGKSRTDQYGSGDCYSPRNYEGSRQKSHHTELSVKPVESPYSLPQATSSKIVTIAKSSPHLEVSKPFEMTDFFKYSERLRRLRLVEQYQQELMGSRSNSPSHHSSDSDPQSPYHKPHPHPAPAHSQFRSGSNPSPVNSPLSSRHMKFAPIGSPDGDHTSYGNSVVSQTYNQGGVSTTMSRVQYTVQSHSGQVLYKAQHHSSKQTHYQPPQAMKCNPVRDSSQVAMGNSVSHSGRPKIHHQRQRSTPERTLNSVNSPVNSSFHLSPPGTLSKAFSNEMLEWIDGDGNQPATSV